MAQVSINAERLFLLLCSTLPGRDLCPVHTADIVTFYCSELHSESLLSIIVPLLAILMYSRSRRDHDF